ncbi:unnamed protein product, partial [Ectocarpus sp. 12 AP-2014]
LQNLQQLFLHNNQLAGDIPKELKNSSALSKFTFGNAGSLAILSRGGNNKSGLTGGPVNDEGLDSWRKRMRDDQKIPKIDRQDVKIPFPISSEDRAALLTLFLSTGGTKWKKHDKWGTDAELWRWQGVNVNQDGRVVMLDLSNKSLEGPFPEALRDLKELKRLYLSYNNLTGSIPSWLGFLRKLQGLRLSSNHLTGPIPVSLGALTDLTHLDLRSNKLTGLVPQELGALKELEILGLGDNELTGPIPEALGAVEEPTERFPEELGDSDYLDDYLESFPESGDSEELDDYLPGEPEEDESWDAEWLQQYAEELDGRTPVGLLAC